MFPPKIFGFVTLLLYLVRTTVVVKHLYRRAFQASIDLSITLQYQYSMQYVHMPSLPSCCNCGQVTPQYRRK